jgi:hypothetical protein
MTKQMTLIQRLHSASLPGFTPTRDICWEAADEIRRLTVLLDGCRADWKSFEQIAANHAREVVRMRALLAKCYRAVENVCDVMLTDSRTTQYDALRRELLPYASEPAAKSPDPPSGTGQTGDWTK